MGGMELTISLLERRNRDALNVGFCVFATHSMTWYGKQLGVRSEFSQRTNTGRFRDAAQSPIAPNAEVLQTGQGELDRSKNERKRESSLLREAEKANHEIAGSFDSPGETFQPSTRSVKNPCKNDQVSS